MANAKQMTPAEMLEAGRQALQGKMYPNMDELPEMTLSNVLANVDVLYNQEQEEQPGKKNVSPIYSQVGPVLIALNPFRRLPCYDASWRDAYRHEGNAGRIKTAWQTLGPHCYCTIEEVYQGLKSKNQSVVICGESGAGKTVTNKFMLDYLLDIGCHQAGSPSMQMTKQLSSARESQKDQLEAASEALEAFGNAKTMRNDNSSRFGKYSKLFFEKDLSAVCGLKMEHYLLERSRLVHVPDGERNYHIIHMLAEEEKSSLNPEDFAYIDAAARVTMIDKTPFDDQKDFGELKKTMAKAGFDDEYQRDIYNIIKGLMYMGNVTFLQSEGQGGDLTSLDPACGDALTKACDYLGVDQDKMLHALTHKVTDSKTDGIIHSPIKQQAAVANRDAVAKTVYSKLFDKIVAVMNDKMGNQRALHASHRVGLLDIFGFEDMPINSFEQLFINLTNEWIQNLFNKCMFNKEIATYEKEGIPLDDFQPPDNFACVKLFIGELNPRKPGIITLMTDAVKSPTGKDGAALVSVMGQELKKHWSDYFHVCTQRELQPICAAKTKKWKHEVKLSYEDCFMVKHYAGDVVYTVQHFIPKSKDFLAPHLGEVLQASTRKVMHDIFEKEAEAHKTKAHQTIGEGFKTQLSGLMMELEDVENNNNECCFVRCIKPNPRMTPGVFDEALVKDQLECGGVVAALKMRSNGLPDRMEFREFVNEFWCLEPKDNVDRDRTMEPVDRCKALMRLYVGEEVLAGNAKEKHDSGSMAARYRMGQTKVFMKSGILPALRVAIQVVQSRCARQVQRRWRAKQGINLVVRLGQIQQQLESCMGTARQKGVDKQRQVVQAIQEAEKSVEQAFSELKQDPTKWSHIEEGRSAATGSGFKREVEKTCAEIPVAKLPEDEVERIESLAKKAHGTISAVVANWAVAEARLSELVTEKKNEASAQLSRVSQVAEYCNKDNLILETCAASRTKIESIIQQGLPDLRAQVLQQLDDMDLLGDTVKLELPAQATEIVKECERLAVQAEKDGEAIIERRKNFEYETMRATPELQAATKQRAEAKERLELLEGDEKEAVRDGLTSVSQAIREALEWDSKIEQLLQDAADPASYRSAVQSFLAAEKAAQDAIQLVKKLEAEAHEREESNIRNILGGFDKRNELLKISEAFFELVDEFNKHMDTVGDASPTGLGTQKATKAVLRERLQVAQETFDAIGIDNADTGAKSGGRVRLNYRGPWSAECFKLLGSDLEPYRFMARLMDDKRFHAVIDTVEALNAGVTEVEDGYCIAWSATWGQYYMLYQKDKEQAVMKLLEDTQAEIEACKRRERLLKMQRAVHIAVGSAERVKWEENLQKRTEHIERRIREDVRDTLETNFGQRADLELATKTREMWKEASNQIAEAEANKSEIVAKHARIEAHYQEEVRSLEKQIGLVEVKLGAYGELPQLYSQLLDVGVHTQKLRSSFEDLCDHIAEETTDIEEAMAYSDALINNPETLPGLCELVEALTRCQRRHLESEELCTKLQLTCQASALKDVRDQMSQITKRISRIAEGGVQLGHGLEPELITIRDETKVTAKMMGQLNNTFQTWHGRLDKANDLVERATVCADIKNDEVPILKDVGPKAGMWDRMLSGVMENFCASERPVEKKANSNGLVLEGSSNSAVRALLQKMPPKRGRKSKQMFAPGDRVAVLPSKVARGAIRFIGETGFAAGEWVGVELDTPIGKNDGKVNGLAYFDCKPLHGVFVRPHALCKDLSDGLPPSMPPSVMREPLGKHGDDGSCPIHHH